MTAEYGATSYRFHCSIYEVEVVQGLEGGGGGGEGGGGGGGGGGGALIQNSCSFFTKVPFPVPSFIIIVNPVFLSHKYIEKVKRK